MGIIKEFKEFALRGNVVDMAVAVIMGAAFNAIVDSAVKDVIMPPLGYVTGGLDFSDKKWPLKEKEVFIDEEGKTKERPAVALSYGKFINAMVHFLIMAFCVFLLVKGINTLRRRIEKAPAPVSPTMKDCPRCYSSINLKATRCPHCTSEIEPAAAS